MKGDPFKSTGRIPKAQEALDAARAEVEAIEREWNEVEAKLFAAMTKMATAKQALSQAIRDELDS